MYLYTSVPHFGKQREAAGVVHIGVGFLRCSFSVIWHCEGLETQNERRRDSHAFSVYSPLLNIPIRPSAGIRDIVYRSHHMVHAGQLIEQKLHEQGRTVTWFATQLCCTRPNVYKIFRKENIDIHLLWRISCILNHDFFRDLSNDINNSNSVNVSK